MKINKILIYILLLTFLLGGLNAFAEGNNASLPSNPTTITGPDAWQYNDDVEAMRYSIYWAPGETREEAEENFKNNIDVIPIGEVTDISKTGLHYKVDKYTKKTVFDYMNIGNNTPFQISYSALRNQNDPYSWKDSSDSSLISNMPDVYRASYAEALAGQQEWREFFIGPYVGGEPTYENIEVLSSLTGEEISKEDFKSGEREQMFGIKKKGVYKIYAEPMINAIVDGYGQISTFRDLVRQEHDWTSSDPVYTLTGWLTPAYVITGNSMVLIDEEKSLNMIANDTSVYGIPLKYDHATRVIDRVAIRSLIEEDGHAYKSMGVGVFSTPNIEGNIAMVEIEVIDDNGNVVNEIEVDEEYFVRYYAKYFGHDMEEVDLSLIDTYVKTSESSSNYYTKKATLTQKTTLEDQEVYVFDSAPFKAITNTLYTCTTAEPDPVYNTVSSDDFIELEIKSREPNLSLTIEDISPNSTRIYDPTPDIDTNYQLEYSIYYDSGGEPYLQDSIVRFTLNGGSLTDPSSLTEDVSVTLEPGLNKFNLTTNNINVKNQNGRFNITLEVNPDKDQPDDETTYSDNADTIEQNVTSIPDAGLNPCTGTIHRQNDWPVTYTITGREDEHREYYEVKRRRCVDYDWTGSGWACRKYEDYYVTRSRCVGGSSYYDERTSTRSEYLRIAAVNFNSKDSDVNMLSRDGEIKAGYGFELEIIARYTGSESPSRPSSSGSCNRRSVSPGSYSLSHNIPNQIYVVLPDGQIISNYSSTGIRDLLDCRRTGTNSNSQTVRCEIKRDNTFGNEISRKLYVDENTKDGRYGLTVCTDEFSSTSPIDDRPLYDERKVYFRVDGKYTDDVTTHIIQ